MTERKNPSTRKSPLWLDWALLVLCVAAIGAVDSIAGGGLSALYILPVLAGALWKGWPGAVAATAGSVLLLRIGLGGEHLRELWVLVAVMLVAGIFVGKAVSSLKQELSHSRQRAERLSGVYERVQSDFEGMKRAERLSALGQLSAGLAHEIRNPLASISGAAGILERGTTLDPKNSKCIEIIVNGCERLDGLLTNFLNFARPRPPKLQSVKLGPVLENVLALTAHGIRGKTVSLRSAEEAGTPVVDCDAEQLSQVLLNLVLNAIEASPDGGTVEISAERDGTWVTIRVADHGHGVATADVDKLFDPFFTTKELGTGLGLPVAHQIMAQMGGSILVRRNQGGGMVFAVTLPAGETEP